MFWLFYMLTFPVKHVPKNYEKLTGKPLCWSFWHRFFWKFFVKNYCRTPENNYFYESRTTTSPEQFLKNIFEGAHVLIELEGIEIKWILFQRCMVTRFQMTACLNFSGWYWNYNHFHNTLRLFDVLPNFAFTTSETKRNY